MTQQQQRIPGFDLARAYAIFGMYIVNFNIVFGNYFDNSLMSWFLSLFSGNSSTAFVLLAGMGVSLLTWRPAADAEEKQRLQRLLLRRSWFLFCLGLLLYWWWPADILHFYGGYMHLAALLLFVPGRWLLWATAAAVAIFHLLLMVIPYETGWNFERLEYPDFWTLGGFLRNTFYNGWNPIFPWSALFFFGMWLGRQPWRERQFKIRAFFGASAVFLLLQGLFWGAQKGWFPPDWRSFLLADYLPPLLPFLLSGGSAAVLTTVLFCWLGERFEGSFWTKILSQTGQMTLTHYILHLTLGMLLLSALAGQGYGYPADAVDKISPTEAFLFSLFWFFLSVVFSCFWKKRFKNGPFEALMRWWPGLGAGATQ